MKQNHWRNQITGTENKRLNILSYCCCNNKSDLETCSPTRSWVASISCQQSRASPASRRCLFPCCHSEPWWPAQGRASPLVPRRPGIGTLALRLVTRRPPLAVLLRPLPRRIWGMERAPCLRGLGDWHRRRRGHDRRLKWRAGAGGVRDLGMGARPSQYWRKRSKT